MNTRSLKFRLTVWHAGWLSILFIVFGVFVYASLGHYLRESLREALARRTRQVSDLVQRSPAGWPDLGRVIRSHFSPEANNRFTRVTLNGQILYVADSPSDRSFNPAAVPLVKEAPDGESFASRTCEDGVRLFIVVLARSTKEGRLVVEEGSAEAPIKATLHAWLTALISGLALLISGAMLGGYLLLRNALTPVNRLIRSAEQISSRNLSERLPIPETRDELEHLSTALNNMIRRLDESFQHNQRFLADASHELRTPLTIIQAELERINAQPQSSSEVRGSAHSALEEVDRLKKIVEGLFALSRLEAGEGLEPPVVFDLAELAASTAEQMSLLAEDRGITIRCQGTQPVRVLGDRARLKQVVVNLLDNALKYSPDHGKIEVIVREDSDWAILEVADNGMGIAPEFLPHLFDRFYRVDEARSRDQGGAGLGLSIVKSICAAHKGQVEAISDKGVGTTFRITLPRASLSGG